MITRTKMKASSVKAIVFTACSLILLPIGAMATPITITATGTVYSSEDDNNYFGLGTGNDTMSGATIVAEFMFDTDDSGSDVNPHPKIFSLKPGTKWISSTTQVSKGGVTLNLTPDDIAPTADILEDQIQLLDEYGSGDGSGGLDEYFIQDYALIGRGDEAYSQLEISSFLDNIITSLDINQIFSWTSGDSVNDFGEGFFALRNRDTSTNAVLNYHLDTFTIAVSANVPEPTALFLLLIGLMGMGFVRSRPVLAIHQKISN